MLDQAEIPTFQERKLSAAETLARKRGEVEENGLLVVNGRRVPRVPAAPRSVASAFGE